MHFDELRQDYSGTPLLESEVDTDPVVQFDRWFQQAVDAKLPLCNAMTLATVDASGQPSARIVLLKGVDDQGFVFFSGYHSRKGHDMLANPRVALLFYWEALHRQVRVEGTVSRISAAESDEYFRSRPRDSNLAAIASDQSQVVASRAALEVSYGKTQSLWEGRELVRPVGWGGYRVAPERVEFWQGRENRLHDRLVYERDDLGGFQLSRLCP